MTKANLITAINNQLTAVITQAKVRLASLQLVNELYNETINNSYQSGGNPVQSILTASNQNLFFNCNISKKGNLVTITGRLRTLSNSVPSGTNIGINNNEYICKSGFQGNGYFQMLPSGGLFLQANGSTIQTGAIPSNTEIYFTLIYPTAD